MVRNTLKYMFVLILVIGVAGALSWFLFQWMLLDEPIPDGALKVMGWVIRSCL